METILDVVNTTEEQEVPSLEAVIEEEGNTEPQYDYTPPQPTEFTEQQEGKGLWQQYAEVMNPYAQEFYDESMIYARPSEEARDWDPSESPDFYDKLTADQKALVFDAPTLEFAQHRLTRNAQSTAAAMAIADDSLWTAIPMSLATGIIAPETLIPGGFVFKQAKSAYTVSGQITNLAQIAGTSAAAAMVGATAYEAAFAGTGQREADYLQANLWAAGIGGGLPIIGRLLSGSPDPQAAATFLNSSPKEFGHLAGDEINWQTEPWKGTPAAGQAKTWYNKFAPKWLKSNVMITAESSNENITNIAARIDSPGVAMVDRVTGVPIPKQTTSVDFKLRMRGELNLWKTDLNGFRQEASEFGFQGDTDAFQGEIGRLMRKRANTQEMKVYEEMSVKTKAIENELKVKLDEQLAEAKVKMTKPEFKTFKKAQKIALKDEVYNAKEKARSELYDANPVDFDTTNPGILKALERTDEFYTYQLQKGVDLGSTELAAIPKGRHYMTRIFDFSQIRHMDISTLSQRLRQGIMNHPTNKGASTNDIDKLARSMAEKLKSLDYDKNFIDTSMIVPKELGINHFMRDRKYRIDEDALGDLLMNNMEEVMGQYVYKQSGQMAALHAFPELGDTPLAQQAEVFRTNYIEPLKAKAIADMDAMSPVDRAKANVNMEADLKALEEQFNDMLGSFRIAQNGNSAGWKTARILNMWNSLTYGGAFALNTAAETGGLLLSGGMGNVFKARLAPMKEIGTMFSEGRISDPIMRDFVLMGNMESMFEYKGMMRMADTEGLFNAGRLEDTLGDLNGKWYKWNGLRPATVALETLAGPKIIHDIMDMGAAGKVTLSNQKYLARIGLSVDDATAINTQLQKHGKFSNKKITDASLQSWDDDGLVDKYLTAVGTGIRHTIIQGDTTYLPSWMINPNGTMGAFSRMVMNFLRYPMAATETLMARGFDEDTAKMMAATVTSAMAMATVLYMREQGQIAAGLKSERDSKYKDAFELGSDGSLNLINDAMTKVGVLGGTSLLYEKVLAMTGTSTPGTEYAQNPMESLAGPGFSRIPQVAGILNAMTSGEMDSKQMWYGLKGLTPGASYPVLNEGLNYLIREKAN